MVKHHRGLLCNGNMSCIYASSKFPWIDCPAPTEGQVSEFGFSLGGGKGGGRNKGLPLLVRASGETEASYPGENKELTLELLGLDPGVVQCVRDT